VKYPRQGIYRLGCHKLPSSPHIVQYTYKRYAPNTWCLSRSLFNDTCIYAANRKEGNVLRELQRYISDTETWYERWNIKINEDKTQVIYFSRRLRSPEANLTLNGRNIPFINHAKYLGVIFDKKTTRRLHIEMIEAMAFRTFIRI
jgi:hypothetical protein